MVRSQIESCVCDRGGWVIGMDDDGLFFFRISTCGAVAASCGGRSFGLLLGAVAARTQQKPKKA